MVTMAGLVPVATPRVSGSAGLPEMTVPVPPASQRLPVGFWVSAPCQATSQPPPATAVSAGLVSAAMPSLSGSATDVIVVPVPVAIHRLPVGLSVSAPCQAATQLPSAWVMIDGEVPGATPRASGSAGLPETVVPVPDANHRLPAAFWVSAPCQAVSKPPFGSAARDGLEWALTVTFSGVDAGEVPPELLATAVSVCAPRVAVAVSHSREKSGPDVEVPITLPSSL